jgi:alpha-mannosidase
MTYRHHHHHLAHLTPEELAAHDPSTHLHHHVYSGISRRGFLRGGVAAAIGVWVVRIDRALGAPLARLQGNPKRIYLAPDDHTDYFWSGNEDQYRQWFLQMLDYYLDRADDTAGKPSQYQSRWNCDGSFWVWTYEQNRTSAQFTRLITRIRDGHVGVPLNALCVCLGGVPAEAVLRGMYYPGQLERRYNVRFHLAYSMENQTLPYGLGALWAGAGAKYSWKGICGCATQVQDIGNREHEIYWWVGPDGSRILMKWYSLYADGESAGGYAEARHPSSVVPFVDSNSGFLARYVYPIIGLFGQGWDDSSTMDQTIVNSAPLLSNSSRQIIVSNEYDFFQDFESTNGASLPSLSCGFGNEWELAGAALAEPAARVKRAVEKLRTAEALATLVNLKDLTFMNGREATRDLAWMDLGLYWEHNMGGGPGDLTNQRIAWQKRLATEIETYVNGLFNDAATALGGLIQKSGVNMRFYVFNPLSWVRTDIADFPYNGSSNIHVVDLSSNQDVPLQIISIVANDGVTTTTYLRILATDVPSVGYKVFEIRSGLGADFSAGAPTANGSVIENQYYQVTVASTGAITSLIDKQNSNRQYVQAGQALNYLGPGTGSITIENAGPVSATLLITVNSSNPLKRRTRITIVRDTKRVEIRNDLDQNFDATYTWDFRFNLNTPDLRHEEVGAVILARLTSAATNPGHYSPRNARYDWLTLNHFADMTGSGSAGVTLSNADCYYMQRGASTYTTLDTTTARIKVLVGGRDLAGGVVYNQGGDTHFLQRFALQTHGAYDQVGAMKFALEHQNPLVTGAVTGGSAYPEQTFSLLTIDNANVLLWALKPADDGIFGSGVVARVWNLSDAAANFTLTLPDDSIASANELTHIETPLGSAPVNAGALSSSATAQQIRTFSIYPESLFANFHNHVFLPVILKD